MDKKDIIEVVKLLTTINSGTVVLTITLLKDLFHSKSFNRFIKAAWAMLILSTIFCILSINQIPDTTLDNAFLFLGVALFLNIVGTIFVIIFVMKAIHKDENDPTKPKTVVDAKPQPKEENNKLNPPIKENQQEPLTTANSGFASAGGDPMQHQQQ